MTLTQAQQDRVWAHATDFDASNPRQRTLARHCRCGQRVLNIGVGNGVLEAALVARGCRTWAIDPTPAAIARLEQQSPQVMGTLGSIVSLPYPCDFFDVVILTEVLEHLPPATAHRGITEIRRVLRRDGLLLLTVPANERLADGVTHCPHCDGTFHRWGHEQAFTKDSLTAFLNAHGFSGLVQARAFADFSRRSFGGLAHSIMRGALGRLNQPIVNPVWFVIARMRF